MPCSTRCAGGCSARPAHRVNSGPRWLAARGRDDEARDVLGRINGPEEAARELAAIRGELAAESGSFTLSLAPVGWVVVSEIYPNRIRAKALAVVCCLLYLASFLSAQFFPMITAACEKRMGHPGAAYLIFAGICLSCVAFVRRWLPETKDLALESIGRFWKQKRPAPGPE